MKTQSLDTHPEAERIMIDVIRNAPLRKRFRLIQSLTQGTLWSNFCAWQQNHQKVDELDAAVQYISSLYDDSLAQCVRASLEKREQWHIQSSDLLTIIYPIVQALEALHITYYLGGSIASSLHGMQQMAQDIDLVVDLQKQAFLVFSTLIKQDYAFDTDAMQSATQRRISFPLIHLDTLTMVDIILLEGTSFDRSMFELVTSATLDERYPPFRIASAYEMILWKLHRYQQDLLIRKDGMKDDAEWNDVLGMLKVQGSSIDTNLLRHWAEKLDIVEVLRQALADIK